MYSLLVQKVKLFFNIIIEQLKSFVSANIPSRQTAAQHELVD